MVWIRAIGVLALTGLVSTGSTDRSALRASRRHKRLIRLPCLLLRRQSGSRSAHSLSLYPETKIGRAEPKPATKRNSPRTMLPEQNRSRPSLPAEITQGWAR